MNHITGAQEGENGPAFLPTLSPKTDIATMNGYAVPAIIIREGEDAVRRFVEFFTATIRNTNTRGAYAQAIGQFLEWCERNRLRLVNVTPVVVASYIEHLGRQKSVPTVKQHLAAIRMCFDWMVTGHVMPINPAWSVRGPRYSVKKGKTPVLTAAEARQLIDSIDITTITGLRDRALIGGMVYSFARVSAVVGMNVEDYYAIGKRAWIRLKEKGGKHHEVPAHHNAVEYLDAYLTASAIADDRKMPLFRTLARPAKSTTGRTFDNESTIRGGMIVTANRMSRMDVLRMIKRRSIAAGIDANRICCHTFRATGITAYLDNGGTLEHAQAIAAHESPRTTKLYDRTADTITLDEVERIAI